MSVHQPIKQPMEEIVMAFSEQQIEKAVRSVVSEHLNEAVDNLRSQAEDELSNIASEVESVIENYVNDAVRNMELDEDALEELLAAVTEKLHADLKEMVPEAGAPREMTTEERYAEITPGLKTGELLPVYINALARPPDDGEIDAILRYIAQNHERSMALFYWNYLRRGVE